MSGLDAEAVKDALQARAEELFRQAWGDPVKPGGKEWRAKASSARYMHMRGPKRGGWGDYKAGTRGDLLDFFAIEMCGLSRARDDFPRVLAEAASWCGIGCGDGPDLAALEARRAAQRAEDDRQAAREAADKARLVEALQARSEPLEGSPAAAYLAGRGISLLPEGWSYLPPVPGLGVMSPARGALVAWAVDAFGDVRGGQRVLILPDGRKAPEETRKPSFGTIGGAPARIAARAPGGPLCIAEGPETAAAIAETTGFETWAVFGVSGFASAPVPIGRQVILCPDRDAPGSPAAETFAGACVELVRRGADIWIADAPEGEGSKRDLADTLQDRGPEAVKEAVKAAVKFTVRDARGRFTGAGAAEAEAVPLPDFMEPEEARELIRQAIRAFLVKVAAWWATDETLRGPVPVLVIAASPGTGKSRIAREELGRFDLTALGGDAVFYAPTLGLAEEAAGHAAELGAGSHVTRGRTGPNPETGDPMCARSELAEQVAKLSLRVFPSLCKRVPEGGGEAILCPFHASCAHVRQWESLPPVNVLRFEATSYATLSGDGSGRKTGLHVIDETLWPQLIGTADIPLDQWTRPRRARGAATLAKEADAAAMAADATAAAAKVLSALQAGRSPLGIGFSAGDFRQFADAERGPDVLAHAPDAPDDKLAEELSSLAKVSPYAGKRAAVWGVLADAAERGLEATERVRIVRNVTPQGGGDPRDVLRVSWTKEPPRDAPVILLDADAAPEIVERLYPGAEVVRAELRPRAEVVQVSDVTLSLNALGAGKRKGQEADPIKGARNRADMAALVRWEVYRDRLTGGRGVLAIASRKVVLRMFTDAGQDFTGKSAAEVSDFMLTTPLHGARWLWFGPRALGRNDWQHFGTAVVIGREELPLDALQDQARALFGDGGEPLELIPECGAMGADGAVTGRAEMPLSRVPYCMADGSGAAADVRVHPDPQARALQGQQRELATRQGFERLRLATATEPKRVVIACKVPIPGLPVTRLVRFAELVPDRARQAMAEAAARGGVLRISAAGLAEDAPETFPTVKAAEQWLGREGRRAFNTPAPVIESIISGEGVITPIRVRLRLPGQRGPHATPALVVVPGNPRALAEAQLGPLATFEVIDPVPVPEPRANVPPEICEPLKAGELRARARIGASTPAPVAELADERLWRDAWRDAKRRMAEAAAGRESARAVILSRDPPRPVTGSAALSPEPDPVPARRLVFAPRMVPLPELVAILGEPRTVWRETRSGWVPGWTRGMSDAVAWVFARYRGMTPQTPEAWT